MASGWTSPYLTHHPVFTSAAEAVTALRDGWQRLREAIERADDDQLEVTTAGYTYAAEPPRGGVCVAGPPGPAHPATRFIAGTLTEIGHHGTQIGALRDLYAWRQIDRAHGNLKDHRHNRQACRSACGRTYPTRQRCRSRHQLTRGRGWPSWSPIFRFRPSTGGRRAPAGPASRLAGRDRRIPNGLQPAPPTRSGRSRTCAPARRHPPRCPASTGPRGSRPRRPAAPLPARCPPRASAPGRT